MSRVGFTVFNFRDGGLHRDGLLTRRWDLCAGADAVCAAPDYLDVVVMCEAKEYGFHGGAALHGMAQALAEASGRPMVGMLGRLDRGEFGPAIFYDANTIGVLQWYGHGVPAAPRDKVNFCRVIHRATGVDFGLMPVHRAHHSPHSRFAEAELVTGIAGLLYPALLAGDTNALASGPHEPTRDFTLVPPWKAVHKGCWPLRKDGSTEADTDVMDYLIGPWQSEKDRRASEVGFSDFADLDALDHSNHAALAATTTRTSERGGAVRIDRALGNAAAVACLIPGSVRVDPPRQLGPQPSDHLPLRFALDMSKACDTALELVK